MKWLSLCACAALAILVLGIGQTKAAVLTADTGWQVFFFGDVGDTASDTFTVDGPVLLTVTDAFLSGDQFEILDGVISLGLTSAPGSVGDQIGSDYDAAAADSRWSSGSFLLGPGSHTIKILVAASPFGGGAAAIRADSVQAVPEPSSLAIFSIAVGGLFVRRLRRGKRSA